MNAAFRDLILYNSRSNWKGRVKATIWPVLREGGYIHDQNDVKRLTIGIFLLLLNMVYEFPKADQILTIIRNT